jgi:hypothetical protein
MSIFKVWDPERQDEDRIGCVMLTPDCVKENARFLNINVLDNLSIAYDAYLPFDVNDASMNNNTDYRYFRTKPLIKMADGSYLVYNPIILLERLYSSLYFDIKSLSKDVYRGTKFDYTQWFNKEFIEHRVFQRTMLMALPRRIRNFFPSSKMIELDNPREEVSREPDFYMRDGDSLFLFECKSLKLNGIIKDKADVDNLVKHLKLKLFYSGENIDPTRGKKRGNPVGITQLIEHLKEIDENTFAWDNHLPDPYFFYPVIVLDDWKLSQCGMSYLLNVWYQKQLSDNHLQDSGLGPLIVMSIDTLYFYSEIFRVKGFKTVFECYYQEEGFEFDSLKKVWSNPRFADFDRWMRKSYTRSRNLARKVMNECRSMIHLCNDRLPE